MSSGISQSGEKKRRSSINCSLGRDKEVQTPPPLKSFIILTVLTCFCPAWPINIVALVFSLMSQKSYANEDYDGSQRLGKMALYMAFASVFIGLLILTIFCIVHFTTNPV